MGGPDGLSLQCAHTPGRTVACINAKGNALLTGGADSLVQCVDLSSLWFLDSESQESTRPPQPVELPTVGDFHDGHAITCMALSPDATCLVTGDDKSSVRVFDILPLALPLFDPDADDASPAPDDVILPNDAAKFTSIATKFGGPVRGLAFSPSGAFLACVSDEPGVVKFIQRANGNVSVYRADDTGAPSHGLATILFDPQGDLLVTVSDRGLPQVWSIDSQSVIASILASGVISPNTSSTAVTVAAFSHDGTHLAFAMGSGKAIVVPRIHPSSPLPFQSPAVVTLPAPRPTKLTAIAWAPSLGYIVTGDNEGQVLLWQVNLATGAAEVIEKWPAEDDAAGISFLGWIPGENAFAVADENGQWAVVGDVVEPHLPAPVAPKMRTRSQPQNKESSAAGGGPSSDNEEVSEDDDDIKRSKRATVVDDLDDDESEPEHPNAAEHVGEELDDYDDDEDTYYRDLYGSSRERKKKSSRSFAQVEKPKPVPFMPSSTPDGENVQRRILHWNLVGTLSSTREDTKSVVELEFADSSKRPVRFADHYGYTQGYLTETGAFFGCPPSDKHTSCVFYRPFASWSTNAEWTLTLPEGETSVLVALGRRFACCLTSKSILRVFSLSGIQTDLFRVSGSPVSIAASGDRLCIVTCLESGQLWYELFRESESSTMDEVISSGPLPLSPDSTVRWIGFRRDSAELVVFDSAGGLQCLVDSRPSHRWTVLLQNAAKYADADTFWIAAVTIECAIGAACYGDELHPSASPRPALKSVKLINPLVDRTPALDSLFSSNMELWRAKHDLRALQQRHEDDDDEILNAKDDISDIQLDIDKALLKLMEEACRASQGTRALELFSRLHMEKSTEIAMRLANHYRMPNLIPRMELVFKAKQRASISTSTKRPASPVQKVLPSKRVAALVPGEESFEPGPEPSQRHLAHSKKVHFNDDVEDRPAREKPSSAAPSVPREEPEASDDLTEIRPLPSKVKKDFFAPPKRSAPSAKNPFAIKAPKKSEPGADLLKSISSNVH